MQISSVASFLYAAVILLYYWFEFLTAYKSIYIKTTQLQPPKTKMIEMQNQIKQQVSEQTKVNIYNKNV